MGDFDYSRLRGKIVEKYRTNSAFADAMGISEQSLSAKLNNKISFMQDEMLMSAELLSFSTRDIGSYFFTLKTQSV